MTTAPTAPRPTTRPRWGLGVLAGATFLGVSTELLPIGLLPQISADLAVPEAAAGAAVSGYALVVALTATPLTAATARWPRRRLLVAVLLAYAVSNALAATAPSFGVLLAARALGGLCHGVFWSMVAGFAARLVPPEQVGRATSAVFAGNALAVAVGLPLGTALGGAVGWRAAVGAAAVGAVALAVLARFLLPPLAAVGSEPAGAPGRPVGSVRAALARPGVRAVAGVTGLLVLGHYTFFSYVTVHLRDVGVPAAAVGAALLAYGAAGVAGTVLLGRAHDRRPGGSLAAVTTVLLGALAGLALLGLADPAPWVTAAALVLVAVLGAAAVSVPVALQGLVLHHAGPAPDAASSLFVAAFNLGIGGGALIGGLLLTGAGSSALPAVALVLAATAAGLAVRTGLTRTAAPARGTIRQPAGADLP